MIYLIFEMPLSFIIFYFYIYIKYRINNNLNQLIIYLYFVLMESNKNFDS